MPSESKENNGAAGIDLGEACTACHQYFDKTNECDGNYVPLTRDEEAILARMREVKAKVAELKNRLRELESGDGFQMPVEDPDECQLSAAQSTWLEQTQKMEILRTEWRELDEQRQEAARFRMKVLGHED